MMDSVLAASSDITDSLRRGSKKCKEYLSKTVSSNNSYQSREDYFTHQFGSTPRRGPIYAPTYGVRRTSPQLSRSASALRSTLSDASDKLHRNIQKSASSLRTSVSKYHPSLGPSPEPPLRSANVQHSFFTPTREHMPRSAASIRRHNLSHSVKSEKPRPRSYAHRSISVDSHRHYGAYDFDNERSDPYMLHPQAAHSSAKRRLSYLTPDDNDETTIQTELQNPYYHASNNKLRYNYVPPSPESIKRKYRSTASDLQSVYPIKFPQKPHYTVTESFYEEKDSRLPFEFATVRTPKRLSSKSKGFDVQRSDNRTTHMYEDSEAFNDDSSSSSQQKLTCSHELRKQSWNEEDPEPSWYGGEIERNRNDERTSFSSIYPLRKRSSLVQREPLSFPETFYTSHDKVKPSISENKSDIPPGRPVTDSQSAIKKFARGFNVFSTKVSRFGQALVDDLVLLERNAEKGLSEAVHRVEGHNEKQSCNSPSVEKNSEYFKCPNREQKSAPRNGRENEYCTMKKRSYEPKQQEITVRKELDTSCAPPITDSEKPAIKRGKLSSKITSQPSETSKLSEEHKCKGTTHINENTITQDLLGSMSSHLGELAEESHIPHIPPIEKSSILELDDRGHFILTHPDGTETRVFESEGEKAGETSRKKSVVDIAASLTEKMFGKLRTIMYWQKGDTFEDNKKLLSQLSGNCSENDMVLDSVNTNHNILENESSTYEIKSLITSGVFCYDELCDSEQKRNSQIFQDIYEVCRIAASHEKRNDNKQPLSDVGHTRKYFDSFDNCRRPDVKRETADTITRRGVSAWRREVKSWIELPGVIRNKLGMMKRNETRGLDDDTNADEVDNSTLSIEGQLLGAGEITDSHNDAVIPTGGSVNGEVNLSFNHGDKLIHATNDSDTVRNSTKSKIERKLGRIHDETLYTNAYNGKNIEHTDPSITNDDTYNPLKKFDQCSLTTLTENNSFENNHCSKINLGFDNASDATHIQSTINTDNIGITPRKSNWDEECFRPISTTVTKLDENDIDSKHVGIISDYLNRTGNTSVEEADCRRKINTSVEQADCRRKISADSSKHNGNTNCTSRLNFLRKISADGLMHIGNAKKTVEEADSHFRILSNYSLDDSGNSKEVDESCSRIRSGCGSDTVVGTTLRQGTDKRDIHETLGRSFSRCLSAVNDRQTRVLGTASHRNFFRRSVALHDKFFDFAEWGKKSEESEALIESEKRSDIPVVKLNGASKQVDTEIKSELGDQIFKQPQDDNRKTIAESFKSHKGKSDNSASEAYFDDIIRSSIKCVCAEKSNDCCEGSNQLRDQSQSASEYSLSRENFNNTFLSSELEYKSTSGRVARRRFCDSLSQISDDLQTQSSADLKKDSESEISRERTLTSCKNGEFPKQQITDNTAASSPNKFKTSGFRDNFLRTYEKCLTLADSASGSFKNRNSLFWHFVHADQTNLINKDTCEPHFNSKTKETIHEHLNNSSLLKGSTQAESETAKDFDNVKTSNRRESCQTHKFLSQEHIEESRPILEETVAGSSNLHRRKSVSLHSVSGLVPL